MKKGFTILELLIVIGIIGTLMAVMLGSLGGASDSARATKCLTHLHNLASACQTVAMANGYFPLAGSVEKGTLSVNRNTSGAVSEAKGWVSWASMNAYKNSPKGHQANSGWFISTYEQNTEKRIYALTNGAIWQAISGDTASFRCPLHEKCTRTKQVEPIWSYVMNSDFGWDDTQGSGTSYASAHGIYFQSLKKSDRKLLFAELPFNADNKSQSCSFSTGAGLSLDPTLQYKKGEYLGFNHKDGKKWYAHVCFADGHTEKMELPKGAGESQIRELTKWLCQGTDVWFNGSKYEEAK